MNFPALAIGSTMFMGMTHALEPGHGKTMLASYVVGERLQWKNIFSISAGMILSHFTVLAVLSVIIQQLIAQVESTDVESVLKIAGPVLIICFGIYLFVKERFSKKVHDDDCECGHHHHHDRAAEKPFVAGLISGMIPCASAIYPVLIAAGASTSSGALFFIMIYVLGMGLIIFGLVTSFYFAKNIAFQKLDNLQQKVNLKLLSAGLIIFVGVVYLGLHLGGFGIPHFHHEHPH